MKKFRVTATQTKIYEIEVEAENESAALAALDDWIEDDFKESDTEVSADWDFETSEVK